MRLSALEETQRQNILAGVLDEPDGEQPSMLTVEQLRELHAAGVAIGAHGLTHAAMPAVAHPAREVTEPRRLLAGMLQVESEPVALSFPHGAYDETLVRSAFEAGYELVFHSDPVLVRLSGRVSPDCHIWACSGARQRRGRWPGPPVPGKPGGVAFPSTLKA